MVPALGDKKAIFNPYDYGDPYAKKTCLWGNFNMPKKTPVIPIYPRPGYAWTHATQGGNGVFNKNLRSMTPPGFAKAFWIANNLDGIIE